LPSSHGNLDKPATSNKASFQASSIRNSFGNGFLPQYDPILTFHLPHT
jgi:hypothetical protein